MSRTKTELIVAAWSATTFGALLTSIMVSRPVRDALAIEGDPDRIPWLFTATFVVFVAVVPVWGKLVARNPRQLVPRAFHFFAACSLVFYAIMTAGIDPLATGYVFYVWSAVFNMLVVSAFWSLLADLFDPATAKKLYGPITAGGTIGAFGGPVLTRLLLEYVDADVMFLLIALFLELAAFGVHQVKHHGAQLLAVPQREKPLAPDPFAGLKQVLRSRYLMTIAGFVLCTAAAATFVYLEQATIAKTQLADRQARTAFFAEIDIWKQTITFACQLLLAAPLLRFLGPGLVLCMLPLAQGAGIFALINAPTLATLAVVQVTSGAVTHGLARPAREVLFTVVERDEKYRAKNVIDTLVLRFGDFAASWLYTGLVAITAIPLMLVWITFSLVLGAGFRRRALQMKESS